MTAISLPSGIAPPKIDNATQTATTESLSTAEDGNQPPRHGGRHPTHDRIRPTDHHFRTTELGRLDRADRRRRTTRFATIVIAHGARQETRGVIEAGQAVPRDRGPDIRHKQGPPSRRERRPGGSAAPLLPEPRAAASSDFH